MFAPTAALLTTPNSIHIEDIVLDGDVVVLHVRPTKATALCPECGQRSSRVHSRYSRGVADLPSRARAVRLHLQVRRFFCATSACRKKTFAERIPELVDPHARVTCRLEHAHRLIGQALGGEAGARLATPLGMPISPDTLLRRVKSSTRSEPTSIRVLGVDDWARKKGQRYGTILCDLEQHRVVDLLPERSTTSFAEWLKAHPEVEVISRDRGEGDTKGAALGAPQAAVVADRWHLLLNLREALGRAVDRRHADVSAAVKSIASNQETERSIAEVKEKPLADSLPTKDVHSLAARRGLQRRARRLERYEQVLELHKQGTPLRAIGRRLGMHRATIRRWSDSGSFPERAKRSYRSGVDRYVDYLRRRWDEGCRKATQLTRELRTLGFSGSYHIVRRRIAGWRKASAPQTSSHRPEPRFQRPSSRKVSWWLLKDRGDLSPEEASFLEALRTSCPELREASSVAREFAAIVRERRIGAWDDWLAKVKRPGVPRELRGFADGLIEDEAAVKGALSQEWSNGQTEGQINRLKLLKRQMYGRAGFELLRSRCLGVA
jgi:transposase